MLLLGLRERPMINSGRFPADDDEVYQTDDTTSIIFTPRHMYFYKIYKSSTSPLRRGLSKGIAGLTRLFIGAYFKSFR